MPGVFYQKEIGLNPCCNGIYSMSAGVFIAISSNWGLNPCCNGIYSMREFTFKEDYS